MTEPTNHRAQAEKWLNGEGEAPIHLDQTGVIEALASIRNALLGIGYALLAGIDVLAEDEPESATIVDYTGTPRAVVNNRCAYTEVSGGVQLRCDLKTGHPPFLRESGHRLRLNP